MSINSGIDALAFVDDQACEREEVRFSLPDVFSVDASDAAHLAALPELEPRFVPGDARLRRQM